MAFDEVVLDVDAALVEVHSANKEAAASNYKGGYGFHRASRKLGRHHDKEVVMT